ncbi:MAG: helix-hairpin-helix domain-containing protein [Methanothrix sp.]
MAGNGGARGARGPFAPRKSPPRPADREPDGGRLRREQQARGGAPQAHGKKTHRTLKEQQEYLVSSIPGVGNAVAKNLLRHFGSVERVFAATTEELKEVELVGAKTAERIRELVGGEYKG